MMRANTFNPTERKISHLTMQRLSFAPRPLQQTVFNAPSQNKPQAQPPGLQKPAAAVPLNALRFGHGMVLAPQQDTLEGKSYDLEDKLKVTTVVVGGKQHFVMLPAPEPPSQTLSKYIAHVLFDHPEREQTVIITTPQTHGAQELLKSLRNTKQVEVKSYGGDAQPVPEKLKPMFEKFKTADNAQLHIISNHALKKTEDFKQVMETAENTLAGKFLNVTA